MDLKQAKRTLMVSVFACLAVIAALASVLVVQFSQWRSLQADITVAEGQLLQLEQRLQRLSLLREHEAELARQREHMQKVLPEEITEEELLREMQKAALSAGCRIEEFRLGEVVFHEQYAELPFDLTIEGRFAGLVKLLDSIQQASKIYLVKEISIQSSSSEGLLRANVRMSSFYIN